MSNTSRNIVIILSISAVVIFFAIKDGKLFRIKKKDNNTAKPDLADKNKVSQKKNAETSVQALRLAINDGASKEDMKNLQSDIFKEYGLNMWVDDNDNIQVKDVSGKVILKEPLVNG